MGSWCLLLFHEVLSITEKEQILVSLGIRMMCPSEATCLSAEVCFSELAL